MKKPAMIAALSFLLIAAVGASLDYALNQDVMGSAGQGATSADYAAEATVGQPAIGLSTSQDYQVCSGFWCDVNMSSVASAGKALIVYRWTFGQVAALVALCALVALMGGRWLYDITLQLWTGKAA